MLSAPAIGLAKGFTLPSIFGAPSTFFSKGFTLPSIFGGTAIAANTPAFKTYNSQTMPLLAPAVNIDPNPAKGSGGITIVDGAALQSQSGPSGTAADIAEWPTSSQVSVYTVHDGDTLSGIAKLFGVSVNTIVWANDLKGSVIHEGETLVILPVTGIRHTVLKDETLTSLATKFKADATEIAQFNGLDPAEALAIGTSILIPNGEITSSVSGTQESITKAPSEPYRGGSGPEYSGYYGWPVNGGVITQGLHGWNAIDIGAPRGTDILAAASGIVIVARSSGWNGGYGNYIVIQHGNGTQTLYSHASRLLVSAGDSVARGQTVALIGASGLATGPHLHFEIRGAKNSFSGVLVGGTE